MYNLSVAVAQTFYVGEGQWLVHNCGIATYRQVGGHHGLPKSAFKDPATGQYIAGYDYKAAYSLGTDYMRQMDIQHTKLGGRVSITGEQEKLYTAFHEANNGRIPTLEEMRDLEVEAMVRAGVNPNMAADVAGKEYERLKALGLSPRKNPFVR